MLSNNLVIGLLTFFAHIGTKWVHEDLDDSLEIFLSNKWMRKLYVFALIYLATDNVNLALALVIIYWVFMYFISKKDT
jgi:hypothetical protein